MPKKSGRQKKVKRYGRPKKKRRKRKPQVEESPEVINFSKLLNCVSNFYEEQ